MLDTVVTVGIEVCSSWSRAFSAQKFAAKMVSITVCSGTESPIRSRMISRQEYSWAFSRSPSGGIRRGKFAESCLVRLGSFGQVKS